MSGEEESLNPPIKPNDMETSQSTSFPDSITVSDGTRIPVALPPDVSPEQGNLVLEYLKQNPTLANHAVRHAERLLQDPKFATSFSQMQQSVGSNEAQRAQMEALRVDPELKPVFDEIAAKGMDAIDKYWNDMELMTKIAKRMEANRVQSAPSKPKFEIKTLHDAAKAGDVSKIEKFIAKGEDINAQDARGITPLGVAIGFNRLEAVEYLLQKGADIHRIDKRGNTVLHYAAGYGRTESSEMLLKAGAKMDVQNYDKQTPLDVAKVNRETATIELLSKHSTS